MNLNDLTIKEARKGLKNKDFSAIDLTKASLERIKKVDDKVKAFITITEDVAMQQAEKAQKRIDKGDETPLLGIPYSMKDVFNTEGIRTTAGSKIINDYIPPYNSTAYQNLIDAGAVLIGKTNCDAFGHGSSTENSDFGPTKNPWDLDRVPGGSSGGSAAALSYGAGLFSIAEDTGGSIRQPAAFCSVTGLKPTWGVVSRYGSIAYASSLDTVGPMAKNAEDIAEVMKVIGKDDENDASQKENLNGYSISNRQDKGIIGIPKEFFQKGNDPEIDQAINNAIKEFEKIGYKTEEVSIPNLKYALECYYLIAASETSSNLARYDGIRFGDNRSSFGEEAKRRIMLGAFALSSGYADEFYLKAMRVRSLIFEDFKNAIEKSPRALDALIAPVSPILPFKFGDKVDDPLQMYLADIYTVPINTAYVPSLALPCGFSKDGLPIGMQLIGRHLMESIILDVAHDYQTVTDWHTKKPNI